MGGGGGCFFKGTYRGVGVLGIRGVGVQGKGSTWVLLGFRVFFGVARLHQNLNPKPKTPNPKP